MAGFLPPYTPDGGSALVPEMPWHYSGTLLTVEYRTDPAKVALRVGRVLNRLDVAGQLAALDRLRRGVA